MKNGDRAGSQNKKDKYYSVYVLGKVYKLHLLIFLYHNGYFPENQVDHKDQNRENNRIENLREVSRSCNAKNSKVYKNSISGIKGVSWYSKYDKWVARMNIKNKSVTLGYFTDIKDAVLARYNAEIEHNWNMCLENSSAYIWLKSRGLV